MDLGHHGLEPQAALQPEVGSGPNAGCRMPQNIRYSPKTLDFGCRAAQKLKKRLPLEHFAFISVFCLSFLPFWIFRGRANSDRLLENSGYHRYKELELPMQSPYSARNFRSM